MAGSKSGDTDPDRQLVNPEQFPTENDQTNRSEVTQVHEDQPVPPPQSVEERGLPMPAGYTDVRQQADDSAREGEGRRSVQPVDDEGHSKSRRSTKNE